MATGQRRARLFKSGTVIVPEEAALTDPAKTYMLDKLPTGYAAFTKTRWRAAETTGPQIDRYLYGHPRHIFRSVDEFYPHFKHLMDHGSANGCSCRGCKGEGRIRAVKASVSTYRSLSSVTIGAEPHAHSMPGTSDTTSLASEPASDSDAGLVHETPIRPVANDAFRTRSPTPEADMVDEEGIPDVFRRLSHQLRHRLQIDETVSQDKSFDWKVEQGRIAPVLREMAKAPMFVPRQGEVVLFCRAPDTPRDEAQAAVTWEAGVVTTVPERSVKIADLNSASPTSFAAVYSGFGIEPMSMPGCTDRHWSKTIAHVPLTAIRPFVLFHELFQSELLAGYHPTVVHALTIASSMSLLDPYHFKGEWPRATTFCRGAYIGWELLMPGDLVRLAPAPQSPQPSEVWDVMKVTSIKLKMPHLDAQENPEYDDPTKPGRDKDRHYDCSLHIEGIGYTRDETRAWSPGKSPSSPGSIDMPQILADYGTWYALHEPQQRWRVPFSRILGRCYEKVAISSWLRGSTRAIVSGHSLQRNTDISKGVDGVLAARNYSRRRDPRIQGSAKGWYWADDRVDQLDLHEVKGQVVASDIHGIPVRNPRAWRRALNIREKGAGHAPKVNAAMAGVRRGRPPKGAQSMLAASAVGAVADHGMEDASTSNDDESANEMDSRDFVLDGALDQDEADASDYESGLGDLSLDSKRAGSAYYG